MRFTDWSGEVGAILLLIMAAPRLVAWTRRRLADRAATRGQALAISLNLAQAYASLGGLVAEQGDLAEAISHYTRAVESLPTYAMAYLNRGAVHQRLGNREEAAADFRDARRVSGDLATRMLAEQALRDTEG